MCWLHAFLTLSAALRALGMSLPVWDCREAASRRAVGLQQAMPLASSVAAAAAAAGSGEEDSGRRGRISDRQADDVRQLRDVLQNYNKGRSSGGSAPPANLRSSSRRRLPWSGPASAQREQPPGQAAGVSAARGGRESTEYPSRQRPAAPPKRRLERQGRWRVVPLSLSPAARQARHEESVRLNKDICRQFDNLDRRLSAGGRLLGAADGEV
jgi:hypothetical protein